MKTEQYEWNEILKDAAKLFADSIGSDENSIKNVATLYKRLVEYYNDLEYEVKIPCKTSFSKKLHKVFDIPDGERLRQSDLYRLLGKYRKMTINSLAHNLTLKSAITGENMYYL